MRLPIYPTAPSISEIKAIGFFNIGDNLFASFPRHGVEINDRVNWAKGKPSDPVRRRDGVPGREDPQRVPARGALTVRGQHDGRHRPRARRFRARPASTTFDQGTGEYKDKVFYASSFLQDDIKVSDRLTLNMGVRFEHSPPWHEVEGRIMHWSVADYNANVRSTVFPQAPRGETYPRRRGFRR